MASREARRKRQRYADEPAYRERILARNSAWQASHREQINARLRRRRAENPELKRRRPSAASQRASTLKCVYGLSLDEYRAMLERQAAACAICGRRSKETLCVDHCRFTREVRGLLCRTCNLGIGHFGDDPDLLRAALGYLEAFTAN